MSNSSESNQTPYDTFMKHSGLDAPIPLAQFALEYMGMKGQVLNAQWVQTEFKNHIDFQSDLVLKVEVKTVTGKIEKHILNIEFQRTNVADYKYTMLLYRAMLMHKYKTESVLSVVIYCGDSPCTMDFAFTHADLPFKVHLIDLCTTDVEPLLSNASLYVRLYAIFNLTLGQADLSARIAEAIVNYHTQYPDYDIKPVMDHLLSICTRTKMSLYMELEAMLKKMGVPGVDYKQSFAYVEGEESGEIKGEVKGEIKKAVKDALKLIQKECWTIEKVIDVLELSEAEVTALRQALKYKT
jgi:hypothetical protein